MERIQLPRSRRREQHPDIEPLPIRERMAIAITDLLEQIDDALDFEADEA